MVLCRDEARLVRGHGGPRPYDNHLYKCNYSGWFLWYKLIHRQYTNRQIKQNS